MSLAEKKPKQNTYSGPSIVHHSDVKACGVFIA